MKQKAWPILVLLSACGISAAPLRAQSMPIACNIPFEFSIVGKTMPAGEYQLSSPRSAFVRITRVTGDSAFSLAYPLGVSASGEQPKLTFNRYGDQYFLKTVTLGEGRQILQFPASQTEQEAARTASSREVRTVTLAALMIGP
jgi:hypothetical protein